MTDLTTVAALHARVYEFLARQDEATLLAVADGTARLTVVGADAAPRPVAPPARPVPTDDPLRTARELTAMTSTPERLIYLNATKLPVTGLKRVAKLLGVTGYSNLTRTKLIDQLVGHDAPRSPEAAAPPRRKPAAVEPAPTPDAPPPAVPGVDPAAIAAHLRATETEEQGAEYLRAQRLDRNSLLAVAAELQLTRVDQLRPSELEKRVLKQAIGARRKFSGLRKW
ncbi:hypothetical protein [Actinophytocola sediminis]